MSLKPYWLPLIFQRPLTRYLGLNFCSKYWSPSNNYTKRDCCPTSLLPDKAASVMREQGSTSTTTKWGTTGNSSILFSAQSIHSLLANTHQFTRIFTSWQKFSQHQKVDNAAIQLQTYSSNYTNGILKLNASCVEQNTVNTSVNNGFMVKSRRGG